MSNYKDASEAVLYDKNGLPIYGMDLELVCFAQLLLENIYHFDTLISQQNNTHM